MTWVLLVVGSPFQQQQVTTGRDHEERGDRTNKSWDDTPPPSRVGTAKTRDPVEPAEALTTECVLGGHQQCDVVKSIVL
jgi:hypothetical protein